MDVIIQNGTLITPSGTFLADVGIVGERITALGEGLRGAVGEPGWGRFVPRDSGGGLVSGD